MNFFSGLEKYGISGTDDLDITKDEKHEKSGSSSSGQDPAKETKVEERDLILEKKVICPVCNNEFNTKIVKTGRVRRKEPDFDLRPRSEAIDTLKYDVTACPRCGYAALNNYFVHLSSTQIHILKEEVWKKFKPNPKKKTEINSYEDALNAYKLALLSAMVKRARISEKAYICLKAAWILRDMIKLQSDDTEEGRKNKKALTEEYAGFYRQAYEGFLKARSTEMPPYCGMDNTTLDFMLANMSVYLHKYETASRLVGNLLVSSAPSRVKSKCVDLKEEIKQGLAKQKKD